jgi:hypothetical protein
MSRRLPMTKNVHIHPHSSVSRSRLELTLYVLAGFLILAAGVIWAAGML